MGPRFVNGAFFPLVVRRSAARPDPPAFPGVWRGSSVIVNPSRFTGRYSRVAPSGRVEGFAAAPHGMVGAAEVQWSCRGRSVVDRIVFNDALPGFGMRLREGGKRTWIVQYRVGEKQRRVQLVKDAAIPGCSSSS